MRNKKLRSDHDADSSYVGAHIEHHNRLVARMTVIDGLWTLDEVGGDLHTLVLTSP